MKWQILNKAGRTCGICVGDHALRHKVSDTASASQYLNPPINPALYAYLSYLSQSFGKITGNYLPETYTEPSD